MGLVTLAPFLMEQFLSILIGVVLPPVVNLVKSKLGLSSDNALLLIGLLIGVLYTAYAWFVPNVTQEAVAMFATSSLGTAMLVYQRFLRKK